MVKVLLICAHVMVATAAGAPNRIGWTNQNIGDATAPGSATYNKQTKIWTVRGDGHDIHDLADGFHYVFQALDGDGAIIAKVDDLSASDPWAKAGVMIRETLDADSERANVTCSTQNGVRFHTRQTTGALGRSDTPVITPEQTALRAPVWVKLERKGDQFFASYATKKEGSTPGLDAHGPESTNDSHASNRLRRFGCDQSCDWDPV